MANYRAIANGNWSNLAIWEDDRLGYFSASVSLPTTADDVYANNFTVTIDGTRNASTIRNTAFTPPTELALMSIPQMSSNTTPSGTAAASTIGIAWNAFDRNTGTSYTTPSNSLGWLSYQFPTGKIIKRYGFLTGSGNNRPTNWTFEGSNNGSTWVVLDTKVGFATGASTFHSFDISANTTSYTYYRINVTGVVAGTNYVIVELEMSEVTNLYGGIVAGGGFTFANGGDLTCTAGNAIEVGSTTPTLTFGLGSGNSATFNGSVSTVTATAGNFFAILKSGAGTFNLVGDLDLNNLNLNAARATFRITATGIINHIGNLSCSQSLSVGTNNTISVEANCTYNHTGNTSGGSTGAVGITRGNTLYVLSNFTYNQTGNIIAGNGYAIYAGVTCNLNHIGNVSGNGNFPAIFNATNPATIDVLGITTSGSGSPAISGLLTTFVKVRGNVIHTDTYAAIYAGRVTIDDNVTSWQFKDSTNTITRTLYTAGVALGNPATTNVRNGVTYGASNELTGTLIVPNPSNVLLGVPTDNTTGTYSTTPALIATEIFTKLLSSTDFNTSGSFGKLVKDNLDAQVSSRLASSSYVAPNNTDISAIKLKTDNLPIDPASDTQVNTRLAASAYIVPPTVTQIRTEMDTNSTKLDVAVSTRLASSSYVAPDNADIAAIKAVTDTLTDVATETTSLTIKTKTDLIPNNPASVESVGAIVASYNI